MSNKMIEVGRRKTKKRKNDETVPLEWSARDRKTYFLLFSSLRNKQRVSTNGQRTLKNLFYISFPLGSA